MIMKTSKQSGAVSIFIVVFTALLVTVVTTGYIHIMMRNQQQASNNDLSQSAYDSALAGVEDAKRALIRLKACEQAADTCASSVQAALDSLTCKTLEQAQVVTFDNEEVEVGEEGLNQAYTCVKVKTDTANYEDALTGDDDTVVVNLKGVSAFNQIRLSWHNQADIGGASTLSFLDASRFGIGSSLPVKSAWPERMPPILRAQLIQFNRGNIVLDKFDTTDARTRFIYPDPGGQPTGFTFAGDTRRSVNGASTFDIAYCSTTANQHGGYFCTATIDLPNPDGGSPATREAYLQLAAIYAKTHFQLELLNSGTVVEFDGVQPEVDATGRASDLFRRVKARVNVSDAGSTLQFPDAALSVRNSLCKDFFVTDRPTDYEAGTNGMICDPTN